MDAVAEPLDLTLQLPRDVYRQAVFTLRRHLPPPEIDTPEGEALRDRAAIARVAAMLPANADEADIAARAVGHAAYGQDCLRLARQRRDVDPPWFMKCCAMASSMERRAQPARTLLARLQADRRKREAVSGATDQDAWVEHCAARPAATAASRTRAGARGRAHRPRRRGGPLRRHVSHARRADPFPGRPARPLHLRPAIPRIGARHRNRHSPVLRALDRPRGNGHALAA